MEIICFRKDINFSFNDGVRRNIPSLIPAFQSEFDKMKKVKHGTQVIIDMTLERDLELLQQFWALTNFTYDNLPEGYYFQTVELFVDYVKIEVGFVEVYKIGSLKKEEPRSMKFKHCPEDEFRKGLYNPAIELYCRILGLTRDELIAASLEYGGPDYLNKRTH